MWDFFIVGVYLFYLKLENLISVLLNTVKNHGIPENIISSGLDAAKRFFNLPDNLKKEVRMTYSPFNTDIDMSSVVHLQLDIHKSSNFKGYTPLLGENTASCLLSTIPTLD